MADSNLEKAAKNVEKVYKAAIGCRQSANKKVNSFDTMKKYKQVNCNKAASIVLQFAGCLKEGEIIGHKKRTNGKGKNTIDKSMYGRDKLKNCKIWFVNKKYKDLPAKYKVAGAVYIYDSNAAVNAGNGYICSCNAGAGYNKILRRYTKYEGGIKRKNKGYNFDHNILVVILPDNEKKEGKKDMFKVIDVSVWQGEIDFNKVKADGITGVIVRYADGNYLDTRFKINMKNAKAAGLHVGAYIFSRAKNAAEAKKEAARICDAVKPYKPDMPVYIDLEVLSLAKVANTVSTAFIDECKARGVNGGIYANLTWFNNYIDAAKFAKYPLWIAQYNSKITYKNPDIFGMWQYSSKGKVNGVRGNCDMNKCYKAYWNKSTTSTKKETSTEKPKKTTSTTKTYIVKPGDTLSAIAKKYKTTVKKIAADNNIKNVNLIKVGQKLKIK